MSAMSQEKLLEKYPPIVEIQLSSNPDMASMKEMTKALKAELPDTWRFLILPATPPPPVVPALTEKKLAEFKERWLRELRKSGDMLIVEEEPKYQSLVKVHSIFNGAKDYYEAEQKIKKIIAKQQENTSESSRATAVQG